ncbi:GntR family transcriptional regulator [Treponema sp. HNW]|uniref:FadR/GntR family transcriptional regulator n=1 Tax=Treponema sp. HNW TaxID=3116654 RepID=UPI003D137BDD
MRTEKVRIKSSKELFIEHMEEMLLTNTLPPGQRLPSERDLAEETGVSRPVIHDALSELGARGLISIRPRHGWIVNDFVKDGSLSILNSLYRFSSKTAAAQIDADLEAIRRIVLTESLKNYFKRKAQNCATFDLADKLHCIQKESEKKSVSKEVDIKAITEQDFLFYRTLIESGGNVVFVLLFNSSKVLYHQKLETFFLRHPESILYAAEMKRELIDAIRGGKEKKALELIDRITSYSTYEKKRKPER